MGPCVCLGLWGSGKQDMDGGGGRSSLAPCSPEQHSPAGSKQGGDGTSPAVSLPGLHLTHQALHIVGVIHPAFCPAGLPGVYGVNPPETSPRSLAWASESVVGEEGGQGVKLGCKFFFCFQCWGWNRGFAYSRQVLYF